MFIWVVRMSIYFSRKLPRHLKRQLAIVTFTAIMPMAVAYANQVVVVNQNSPCVNLSEMQIKSLLTGDGSVSPTCYFNQNLKPEDAQLIGDLGLSQDLIDQGATQSAAAIFSGQAPTIGSDDIAIMSDDDAKNNGYVIIWPKPQSNQQAIQVNQEQVPVKPAITINQQQRQVQPQVQLQAQPQTKPQPVVTQNPPDAQPKISIGQQSAQQSSPNLSLPPSPVSGDISVSSQSDQQSSPSQQPKIVIDNQQSQDSTSDPDKIKILK